MAEAEAVVPELESPATSMERRGRPAMSRLNVILPTEMLQDLKERAAREGVTLTEVLRYAIGLSAFADEIHDDDGQLIVRRRDGSETVILPRFRARGTQKQGAAATERTFASAAASV